MAASQSTTGCSDIEIVLNWGQAEWGPFDLDMHIFHYVFLITVTIMKLRLVFCVEAPWSALATLLQQPTVSGPTEVERERAGNLFSQ